MEDGLVLMVCGLSMKQESVLILVVVEDGLVLMVCGLSMKQESVLILIVVDNGLVPQQQDAKW